MNYSLFLRYDELQLLPGVDVSVAEEVKWADQSISMEPGVVRAVATQTLS